MRGLAGSLATGPAGALVTGLALTLAAAGLAAGATGCGHPAGAVRGSTIRLAARLTDPTDVALRWSGLPGRAAGVAVQFATGNGGQFVVLGFEPPGTTSYRHRDLLPQTLFRYRILPYTGPASAPVGVALPAGPTPDGAHRADPDWAEPRALPDPTAAQHPVTATDGATDGGSDAAPTGLRASVADPNGILFRWTDHASDEQGQLLERRLAGTATWAVVAVLDPDVTSYGLVTLPAEKCAAYRVRPFVWGAPSNVARRTTGAG